MSYIVSFIKTFFSPREVVEAMEDIPDGYWDYKKFQNEQLEETCLTLDIYEYLCQLPYLKVVFWIPGIILLFISAIVLDLVQALVWLFTLVFGKI